MEQIAPATGRLGMVIGYQEIGQGGSPDPRFWRKSPGIEKARPSIISRVGLDENERIILKRRPKRKVPRRVHETLQIDVEASILAYGLAAVVLFH
ncbi:MAG TPA: hypothetical protein VMB73_15430 [Acetobacteraceae bacterium]|nr:hypothetical protein [Acetobacteraceae bacterium]